jgi:hypothetical protein
MLVDASGVALVDADELPTHSPLRDRESALPVVNAPYGPAVELGEQVDPAIVNTAAALPPLLAAAGITGGQVEYHPSSGLALTIPGAPQMVLGFDGDLDAKLAAYRAIRNQLDRTRTTAQLIDVRFLERPYYR